MNRAFQTMVGSKIVWLDFRLKEYTDSLVSTKDILNFDSGLINGSTSTNIDYLFLIKTVHDFILKLEE